MRLIAIVIAALLASGVGTTAADAPPPLAVVTRALVGTWESSEDTRFSREFRADNTVTDSYEGDPDNSQSGNWLLFAGGTPPPEFAGRKSLVASAYYLEIRENGDTLLFGLTHVDRAALQMVNLDRGNTLTFTRLR
jgi:hypothetical protein